MSSASPSSHPREIRVFLSSTFKDMEYERSHLIKQVFPKVRAACLARQVGFTEIDLRWGVSEEEAKSGATVEICLKEVDRCRDFPPFFIGFLGERYGWVPAYEELSAYWQKNNESIYAHPIQQAITRGISVTELEMELAVLQDGASEKIAGHALFCLRDAAFTRELYAQAKADNANTGDLDFYDVGGDKLATLKQKIRQSGFLEQDNYTSIDQFGAAVETYLLTQLDHYFPADDVPTPAQLSNAAHAGFRFQRLLSFLPRADEREQMIGEIARRVDTPALGPILLSGLSGQGKSALMADLAQHYQTQLTQSWRVIDHYVGADNNPSLDGWVNRVLQTLHPDIQDIAGEIPEKPVDKIKALSTWISMAAQRHQCRYLFIIDALDQLSNGGKNLDLLNPQTLGPDGIVIASAANGTPAIEAAANWQTRIEVPALTADLRARFVSDTLARYRKRLPDDLAYQLASAPQSGSPLFLGLALEELRLDARHESLATLIDEILAQPDAQHLFLNNFLLDADYGRPEEPELAARFMALIGAARAGLSEQELSDLLALPDDPVAEDTGRPRLPQIHLSRLLVNLAPFLINKQGRRAPMHRIFGEAALQHEGEADTRQHLYDYFAKGFSADGTGFNARAAAEALHQITELAKLVHTGQAAARKKLVDDLGRLYTVVVLHGNETNDAGVLILAALDLLAPEEQEQVSAMWKIAIQSMDAQVINIAAEGILIFGYWLEYWGHYTQAMAVLKPLMNQQQALHRTEDEEFSDTCSSLGTLYLALAQFEIALPLLQKALSFRERTLGADHRDTATSLNNLANLLETKGDYTAAEPLYRRALEIHENSLGPYHLDTATSLNNLAGLLKTKGDYTAAEPLYRRALEIVEISCGPADQVTASILGNFALLLEMTGDYTVAEPLCRRALAIFENLLGMDHPKTASILGNLANLLRVKGDYVAAEPLYRRALTIFENSFGPDHLANATNLDNLAGLLLDTGDYAAAEPLFRRALTIRDKSLGSDHPDTSACLNNLAVLLKTKGDYAAAEPLYRRAVSIFENSLGPNHPDTAGSLNNLAILLKTKGDYASAEPLYRRALAISENSLGPDHPDAANSLNNLACLLIATGDYAAAEPLYRRALVIRENHLGPMHSLTISTKNNLAFSLKKLDKNSESADSFDKADSIHDNNSTTTKGLSMRLTNTLNDWLKQNEWEEVPEVDEEAQASSLSFGYKIEDFSLQGFFETREKAEIFKLFMYFRETKCPEKRLDEVQKFVTEVSNRMPIGSLQLISDDRVMRFYAAIDVENASFEPAHIQNLLNAGGRTLEDALPKYMAICFGNKTAEDVLAQED